MNVKTHIYLSVWTTLCLIIAVLGLLTLGYSRIWASEIKIPRITKEEVKSMLGDPDVIILDVRSAKDWRDSEWKIKGAVREERKGKISDWMDKYPKDRTFVLYCA
ncbi:MAG: hypothetical protein A2026_11400 [Deltaproteobacteria bacterium RBG_19FT_COMBO_46_12]|nr:MAG: hypothetical protein A2026_11400 [Deltaproteobacteria bacterium RBG_19FT_COMBO_46_12]